MSRRSCRYQTLIQTSFYPDTVSETFSNLHSTSYYAQKLNVHPNHLNAVVKGITGKTALHQIHHHILQLAKSRLAQTQKSIKEIAYDLYFDSPNNFSAFFKKNTGSTPGSYRKQVILWNSYFLIWFPKSFFFKASDICINKNKQSWRNLFSSP